MFNSVKDNRCDKVHFDCLTYTTGTTIDAGELMNIINELSRNNSPGMDGLTAEHIKFADSQLVVLLSIFRFRSMAICQNKSQSMLLYRVIKDNNICVNEKGNYSPICLSNICSKITDAVLFNKMDTYLQTTPHQFGFKPTHGTELCVFTFKKQLRNN